MAIKILVDSASDISMEEAKSLGIEMIPMIVSFGDTEYYDGVDLLPKAFYEKLIENADLPKTGQINSFRFEEKLNETTKDGSEVVVITISSKLSGTYQSACLAAQKFDGKVFVVDSLNACIGERLLCLYALRLKDRGLSGKEIVAELNEKKTKINVMAMVGTLEYLKKGGRVSAVVAIAGEMLSIKPVIAVLDGEVKVVGKAMGSKKANNLLMTLVEKKGGINFDMPYGIVWSGLNDVVLKKYLQDSEKLWKNQVETVPAYMVGSTIGTHVGPNAIGVAFFEN